MQRGLSSTSVAASRSDLGFPARMLRLLSRSVLASPTPPSRRHSTRKARSHFPAIGASSSGGSIGTGPIRSMGPSYSDDPDSRCFRRIGALLGDNPGESDRGDRRAASREEWREGACAPTDTRPGPTVPTRGR